MDVVLDRIPPPLLSFLQFAANTSLRALTALYAVIQTAISSRPDEWDASTLIPPLVTLFAAYLALASLYRTARWTLTVVFFFVKWGGILGVLLAAVAYVSNSAPEAQCDTSRPYSRECIAARNKQRSAKSPPGSKPKPWESHQIRQEWQHRVEQANAQEAISNTFSYALKAADLVFDQQEWWGNLKQSIVGKGEEAGRSSQDGSQGRSKDRAGRSRTR